MTIALRRHIDGLADTLTDLKQQLRNAGRLEVGRVVGEALREFALSTICGPARPPRYAPHDARSDWDWDNAWPGGSEWDGKPLQATPSFVRCSPLDRARRVVQAAVPAIVWTYSRLKHPWIAALVGLAVLALALLGGPHVESLLDAWSSAHELLRG